MPLHWIYNCSSIPPSANKGFVFLWHCLRYTHASECHDVSGATYVCCIDIKKLHCVLMQLGSNLLQGLGHLLCDVLQLSLMDAQRKYTAIS